MTEVLNPRYRQLRDTYADIRFLGRDSRSGRATSGRSYVNSRH